MSVTRSIDPNDYCQTCAWSEDEPDDAGHGYLNVRCERCEKLHDEQRHHEGRQEGAAVAFGLIGMAEAIRARGTDCALCGKRTAFGGRVYQGGIGPVCGIDCLYDHGVR